MNSACIEPNINQCSSCCNILWKNKSKLLKCLHGICKNCIEIQGTDSGVQCKICKLVTDGELIEFPNISKEICKKINCCQEAVDICTICRNEAFCKSCCVDHKQFDNNHQQCENLFTSLQCDITQCSNCNENHAEFLCIQCGTYHCGFCYVMNHNGHDYTYLKQLNKDNRYTIISIKDDLVQNLAYINDSIKVAESHIWVLEKNYSDTKAKINKQWEIIHNEMMYCKVQIIDELEELYRERVSEVNKNISTLQELKMKNEYCTSFTSSILYHNIHFNDIRLVDIIKDNQVNNCISKGTFELLSNIKPEFSITNLTKSLDEIKRVIKSVQKVASSSILDLTSMTGPEMSIKNIEEHYNLTNLQINMERPYSSLVIKKEEDISSSIVSSSEISSMVVLSNVKSDNENEEQYNLENLQMNIKSPHSNLVNIEENSNSSSSGMTNYMIPNEGSFKIVNTIMCHNENEIRNLQSYTRENPNKFDVCKISLSQSCHLKTYRTTHTKERPYKCDICKKSFSQKGSLKSHMVTHTGEKPYKCDLCKKSFSQKGSLKSHMVTHTGEKPFKCNLCKKSFSQRCSLKSHVVTHTGEKPYKCDICKKWFSQISNLKSHMVTHTDEKPYKCNLCEKSFSLNGSLKLHMIAHTGKKLYKCHTCKILFSQGSSLKLHMLNHTGKRPYKCDMCKRSFSQKGNLKSHMFTHTGNRPYKCDMCNHCFSQKGNLKYHLVNHTGKEPYKCNICKMLFSQICNFKSHMVTHGNKP